MTTVTTLPTHFSIKKSISTSFGTFYQSNNIDFDINEKNKTVKCKEMINSGPKMAEQKAGKNTAFGSQIVRRDVAYLDKDNSFLHLVYNLNFKNLTQRDIVNNSHSYMDNAYTPFIEYCIQNNIAESVIRLIIKQVFSGEVLGRNLDMAEDKKVTVWLNDNKYSISNFNQSDDLNEAEEIVDYILDLIKDKDSIDSLRLTVVASADVGLNGAEVYPSQIMNIDKKENDKSRVFFTTDNEGTVGFTVEKIGNNIRCIDNFYEEGATRRIPVYDYGNDRENQEWKRKNKKETKASSISKNSNIFGILRNIEEYIKSEIEKDEDVLQYAYACIIFGGIFGLKNS